MTLKHLYILLIFPLVSLVYCVFSINQSIENSHRSIAKSNAYIVESKKKTNQIEEDTRNYHDCMVTEIAKMRLYKGYDYKAGTCDPDELKREAEIKKRMQEIKKGIRK